MEQLGIVECLLSHLRGRGEGPCEELLWGKVHRNSIGNYQVQYAELL